MRGVRRLKRLILTVVGVPMCWALMVIVGAVFPGPISEPTLAPGQLVRVGLVQGPIHTDFLLPLDEGTRVDFAALDLPETAEWLLVGWGGKAFYTTIGDYGDVSADAIWRTVTGDSAVMRYQPVGTYAPEWTVLLNPVQYSRLREVILADTDFGQPAGINLLAEGDRYFAASGNFNLINTCNQWIARSLRHAGHSFGLWTQTNWAVRLSLAIYG